MRKQNQRIILMPNLTPLEGGAFKAPTLFEAWEEFMVRKTNLHEKTRRNYIFRKKYFTSFAHTPIDEIKQRAVVEWFDELAAARGAQYATQVHRDAKAIINWAMAYYSLDLACPFMQINPFNCLTYFEKLKQYKRRNSIISKKQWPEWLRGVLGMTYPSSRDCVLFQWQTGCRVGESRLLQWRDIDLEYGFLKIPEEKTKTGVEHHVPLSEFILRVLTARRPKHWQPDDFVFEGNIPGKPICDNHRGYNSKCKEQGLAHRFHDIRRSFITVLVEDLLIPTIVVKRLVNHSTLSCVTAGYYISDPEGLRPTVEKISRRLLELAEYTVESSAYTFSKSFKPSVTIPDMRISVLDLGGASVSFGFSESKSEPQIGCTEYQKTKVEPSRPKSPESASTRYSREFEF